MISRTQQLFILCFIGDGDYDFNASCTSLGIRPSEAAPWFGDKDFHKSLKQAQMAKLARLGYGPMLVIEDTLGIAHSDITKIMDHDDSGLTVQALNELPRAQRVAIKSVEFGVAMPLDGTPYVYPKKITMHDKMAALAKAAEWYQVDQHEGVKEGEIIKDEGPKRISGLVVRPPVSQDVAEGEKMLE